MTAPVFALALERVLASGPARDSILTDGCETCALGDLRRFLDRLDSAFDRQGAAPGDVLALECPHSVPGALALLHALSRGRSVLLLPPLGRRYREAEETPFVPAFCRFRVRVPEGGGAEDGSPVCEENPGFTGPPEAVGSLGPKLYLRTSGSTATPKIAVHSHAGLHGNAWSCMERLGLGAGDRIAIPVPIFHMYGLGAAFLPGLLAGASMDLQTNSNLLRYMERETAFYPDVAFLTPGLCGMFVKVRRSPRPYRFTVTAGDRLERDLQHRFEERFGPLLNLYGSTELGAVSVSAPDEPLSQRDGIAGRPLRGVEIALDEVEGGEAGVGEITCRHRYGFEGYVDPAGRRWSREDPGWFRTGDLGRVRAGGGLEVLGRRDHAVNRDGLLVLLGDIETVLEKLDGVDRAVVVARGESLRGKRLVAFCSPREGADPRAEEVRAACFQKLPAYAVPDEVRVVAAWPTLPNGKVDRRTLAGMV